MTDEKPQTESSVKNGEDDRQPKRASMQGEPMILVARLLQRRRDDSCGDRSITRENGGPTGPQSAGPGILHAFTTAPATYVCRAMANQEERKKGTHSDTTAPVADAEIRKMVQVVERLHIRGDIEAGQGSRASPTSIIAGPLQSAGKASPSHSLTLPVSRAEALTSAEFPAELGKEAELARATKDMIPGSANNKTSSIHTPVPAIHLPSDDFHSDSAIHSPSGDIHSVPAIHSLSDDIRSVPAIHSLSDDIIREIMTRVSESTGHLWHALTCSKWASLSPSAQASVRVRETARVPEDLLLASLAPFRHLRHLSLERHSVEAASDGLLFLEQILSQAQQLQGISISRQSTRDGGVPESSLLAPFRRSSTSLKFIHVNSSFGPELEISLPSELCALSSLEELVLTSWAQQDSPAKSLLIRSLPPAMGGLTSLKRLCLRSDSIQSLPNSFTEMTSLTHLTLCFSRLGVLPPGFCKLRSLRSLFLLSKDLAALPDTFVLLPAIRAVHLACPSLAALPPNMSCLTALATLHVERCDSLQQLPPSLRSMPSLTDLAVGAALAPEDLQQRRFLRHLSIASGFLFQLPTQISPHLPRLRSLSFSSDNIWTLPADLGSLSCLEDMTLKCPTLEHLPESSGDLKRLRTLTLAGCSSLYHLPSSFSRLVGLEVLSISSSGLATFPEGFATLPRLRALSLSWCQSLKRLPGDIGSLPSLEELRIETCNLEQLPDSCGSLQALRVLDVSRCFNSPSMTESLGLLPRVERLRIHYYPMLRALPGSLGWLGSLLELEIKGLGTITRLPEELGGLRRLESLQVAFCVKVEEIPSSLGKLSALKVLGVEGCPEILLLPESVGELSLLVKLRVSACARLRRLPRSVGGLASLVTLELRGLDSLGRIPDSIGKLKQLHRLDLQYCPQVEELPSTLGDLTALQRLELRSLNVLRTLPKSLSLLTGLVDLRVISCKELDRLSLQAVVGCLPRLCKAAREAPNTIP